MDLTCNVGQQHALVYVSGFSEAFHRTTVLHTLLIVTHIIFIGNILIIINTSWDSPVVLVSTDSHHGHQTGLARNPPWGSFQKDVKSPGFLIYLLSRILQRRGSWLYSWCIATTAMSTSVCSLPLTLRGRLEIIHVNYRGRSSWASFNSLGLDNFLEQHDWVPSIASSAYVW